MPKRDVLQINTPEGDAILRAKARKIARMDDDLRALARDMVDTVQGVGVGLAAPQIGESVRMIVINVPPNYIEEGDEGFQEVLYNPQIMRRRGGKETDEEGCLSLRYWYGPVERHYAVVVRAYDLQDQEVRIEAHGFVARVLQHEIEHLDGGMFTDNMKNPAEMLRYVDPSETQATDGSDTPASDDGERSEAETLHAQPVVAE